MRRLESSQAAADATAEAVTHQLREARQQQSAAAAAAAEAGGDSAAAATAATLLRQQLARAEDERSELRRQVDQLQVGAVGGQGASTTVLTVRQQLVVAQRCLRRNQSSGLQTAANASNGCFIVKQQSHLCECAAGLQLTQLTWVASPPPRLALQLSCTPTRSATLICRHCQPHLSVMALLLHSAG